MVIRDLANQQAEEGGDVIFHCELSKPGLPIEWKKGSVVLSCGEKYQMKETGLSYELQIFDLKPCDSGRYSCSSGDTISSASLVVNGRMETLSSSHAFLLPSFIFAPPSSPSHCISSSPFLTLYR